MERLEWLSDLKIGDKELLLEFKRSCKLLVEDKFNSSKELEDAELHHKDISNEIIRRMKLNMEV